MGTFTPYLTSAIMKVLVLAALGAVAAAAKLGGEAQFAAVLREDIVAPVGASYSHDIETDNGIRLSQQGQPGSAGQSNIQGSYSFTAPNGENVEVSYACDEFGCQYQSPYLPVAPPHVAEPLRIAEEQRAQGITFE